VHGKPSTLVHADINSSLASRKIKLGITSLYAFLRMMRFDNEGVTSIKDVMRAFRTAAKDSAEPSPKVALALQIELDSDASRCSSRSRTSS
jgi:predicted solute-binding protein